MKEASESSALKIVIEDHWNATKTQVKRLQEIFSNIGQNPQKAPCKVIKVFIDESQDVIQRKQKGPARDAAITSVAQRMEQYEISGYQTACEHAADLGHTGMVEVLNQTLNEERAMNLHLNELVQYMINAQAINTNNPLHQPQQQPEPPPAGTTSGFYISESRFKRGIVKKKSRSKEVSRFISEGNPNTQDVDDTKSGKENKDLENPLEEQSGS
jgi:ferritin-like metal-binding protein YciE